MSLVDNLRKLRNSPLMIICANPREAGLIARFMDAKDRVSGSTVNGINNNHMFYAGKLHLRNRKQLNYYVTSSTRQGLMHFATQAGILFHQLRPRFAIHAGCCAGNAAAKVEPGDVIFGDGALSYEEGKWGYVNGQLQFKPDYDIVRLELAELQSFAEGRNRYKHGEYVSGMAVQEGAANIFDTITKQTARKVLALDMEASAFLNLCKHTDTMSLGVIKGVSDLGDKDKPTGEEAAAMYEGTMQDTATALKEWLNVISLSLSLDTNEDHELGSKIAKGYYEAFPRIVVDALSQNMVCRTPPDKQVLDKPAGLKIVMPKDLNPGMYAEQGQLQRIANVHNLVEAEIGNATFRKTLLYRDNYFIDFPRMLGTTLLPAAEEPTYQTLVFEKALKKLPYCRPSADSKYFAEPLAEVISWEEFEEKFTPPPAADIARLSISSDQPIHTPTSSAASIVYADREV